MTTVESDLGLVCMIAMTGPDEVLEPPLRRALAIVAPHSLVKIEEVRDVDALQALQISIDGQEFACGVFEGSLPNEQLEDACGRAIFWQDARSAFAEHSAFMAIGASEHQKAHGLVRAQAVALTRLTAALVELLPACGVLWSGSRMCASPQRAATAPAEISRSKWPVDFWVGYRFIEVRGEDERLRGVRTHGAADYLGFEIEVPPDPTVSMTELLKIVYHATGYLMNHGDVITDGRLVEVEGERRTRYEIASDIRGDTNVARLRLLEIDHRKLN